MSDITDNMEEDMDLLSILEDSTTKTDVEKAMEKTQEQQDEEDADKKMKELEDMATSLALSASGTVGSVKGSGDLDVDLDNWFNGKDPIPSEPLMTYVSNSPAKVDTALNKHILSNAGIADDLIKFVKEEAIPQLFSEAACMGIDSEEMMDRFKVAVTVIDKIAALEEKHSMAIKDLKLKSNSEDSEMDKLSLLLSSIPSDVLSKVLKQISTTKNL